MRELNSLSSVCYYDSGKEIMLNCYADTLVYRKEGNSRTLVAIRFGGYPEHVRGMSDAINGGIKLEAIVEDKTIYLTTICRMLGVADIISENKTIPFNDVPSDDWAFNNIKIAYEMGIINGFENGKFQPEEPIKYQDAIRIIVSALGFDIYAKDKGGYPNGYLMVASEKGICKDVKVSFSDNATRGNIFKLIYNSLDVEILKQTSFGKTVNYESFKGKNILSEYLSIYRSKGILSGLYETKIDNNSSLKKDEAVIDNVNYKIGKTDINELFGYNVEFYYSYDKNTDERTLLYLEENSNLNNKITISSKDIISYDKGTIKYYENKNKNSMQKEAIIKNSVDVIYNDRAVLIYDDSIFTPSDGEIILLDNNGDSICDVALIYQYENYVVKESKLSSNIIVDKYGKSDLNLNDDVLNRKIRIIKNDKEIKFEDIKFGDVITVLRAYGINGEVITANVSDEKTSGKIEEIINENSNETKVVINQNEYKIAPSYNDAKLNINYINLSLDLEAEFALDLFGRIASISTSDTGAFSYGYLINASVKNGIDNKAELRILTTADKIENFTCAEKIKFNDNIAKIKSSDVITSSEIYDQAGKTIIKQLIYYSVNDKNEITVLNTATNMAATPNYIGYTNNRFTKDFDLNSTMYVASSKMFATKYSVTNSTRIFYVPTNSNSEDDYRVLLPKDLVNYYVNYTGSLYDINNKYEVSAIVITRDYYYVDYGTSPVFLVDKVVQAIDEEGESIYKVYGITNGMEITLNSGSKNYRFINSTLWNFGGTSLADLKQGDILNYVTDSDSKISFVGVLFDADTTPLYNEENLGKTEVPFHLKGMKLFCWTLKTFCAFLKKFAKSQLSIVIVSIGQNNCNMSYENSIRKEVKQMNLSPSNLKTIEHQFDSFCKAVLRNEARNIYKHNKFISNMETSFSSITYKEEKSLFVEDEYQLFCEQLNVLNFVVNIKHELLFDALSTLKPKKRDVVLLRYWLNMTDEEIAKKLNLVRRTVNYMRTSSLNEMKKFMEDTAK